MTHRILLRGTIVLVAAGLLAACGSDDKAASTTAAPATTAAAAATTVAATTVAPATTKAAATTTIPSAAPDYQIPNSLPTATTAPAAAAGASLALHTDATLGPILVDSAGFTMYLFTKDTGTTSVCTDKCATAWPAALVTGTPTAGEGLDAGKLTASAQPDGTMQLTYNGHLLYRFAGDSAAGQTNGQDVNEVWYVVDASGNQVG